MFITFSEVLIASEGGPKTRRKAQILTRTPEGAPRLRPPYFYFHQGKGDANLDNLNFGMEGDPLVPGSGWETTYRAKPELAKRIYLEQSVGFQATSEGTQQLSPVKGALPDPALASELLDLIYPFSYISVPEYEGTPSHIRVLDARKCGCGYSFHYHGNEDHLKKALRSVKNKARELGIQVLPGLPVLPPPYRYLYTTSSPTLDSVLVWDVSQPRETAFSYKGNENFVRQGRMKHVTSNLSDKHLTGLRFAPGFCSSDFDSQSMAKAPKSLGLLDDRQHKSQGDSGSESKNKGFRQVC